MTKISGKVGRFPYPTSADCNHFWVHFDEPDPAEESDFVERVCLLCELYAKKLAEYEERYEDDGK